MKITMKQVALATLLALAGSGCARDRQNGPTAPARPPGNSPEVTSARWIWDREALERAASEASSSPLVQRALLDSPQPGLSLVEGDVVRAEGDLENGGSASVTILPYGTEGDRTRATFVSLFASGPATVAERSEIIVGREPLANEVGFEPYRIGAATVWVKTDAAYALVADGIASRSPERRFFQKFMDCFMRNAGIYADAGARIATDAAPGVPYAAAIGSGIGLVAAAIHCFAMSQWG